jgi:hypothetical protein
MSSLHLITLAGFLTAISFKVLIAANRSAGLLDDKKSCKTVIAGKISVVSVPGSLQIARAASNITFQTK